MRSSIWWIAVAAAIGAACTGEIGSSVGLEGRPSEPAEDPTPPSARPWAACGQEPREPARTPLRRLTRDQIDATVRDLFGDETSPARALPADETLGPFDANTTSSIGELLAERLRGVAEGIASRAAPKLVKELPCSSATEASCVRAIVARIGRRTFRRPLREEEISRYAAVFDAGRAGSSDLSGGVRLVVEAFLQSPNFLFHVELGAPDGATPGAPIALTAHEIAARLSYFLWNSVPDPLLDAAADANELSTEEQIVAQATRMMEDPRFRATVVRFHRRWLGLEEVDHLQKDPMLFPEFGPELRASIVEETRRFVEDVVFEGDGKLGTLFDARTSVIDARLAALYGERAPAAGWARTTFEATPRAGLLNQAAFLSAHARANRTSPVGRGLAVRQGLLCLSVPPPPPGVNDTLPPPEPGRSIRDQLARHREDPQCSTCHSLMDSVGLGFEDFDAIGRHRTKEGDAPVDASGSFVSVGSIDGPFVGGRELAERVAKSEELRSCAVVQWYRFALGRDDLARDGCALSRIRQQAATTDFRIRDLILGLVRSESFRLGRAPTAQGAR
jgi:hypothetical protein